MKTVITLLVLIIFSNIYSTEQIMDKIIFEEEEYNLDERILLDFLNNNPHLKSDSKVQATDLRRGYVAYCAIINNKFYLIDIFIRKLNMNNNLSFKSIFYELYRDGKPFILDWFDGELIFRKENSSITYNKLIIKNGVVISNITLNNSSGPFLKKNNNPIYKLRRL